MLRAPPSRSAIPKKYTWNAERPFATPKAWESELKAILAAIPKVGARKGTLRVNPTALANGLAAVEGISTRVYHVLVYACFSYSVDTTNQKTAAMNDRAQGVFGRVSGAISFVDPELIAIGSG